MSVVLARNWGQHITSSRKKARQFGCGFGSEREVKKAGKNRTSSSIRPAAWIAAAVVFCTAVYLYQVNDVAIKGFEIKETEKKIQQLQKESQKLKIKEVELKSMHNIEKNLPELNLINPLNVSYVEINGPMAFK